VAYPGILFGGGFQQIVEVEDRGQREQGSGGSSPLVRGSGGSCSLVQEISFHIEKILLIFGTLKLFMMTTNLFVIDNVKQLRTQAVLKFYCLFFRACWGVGVLNSAIFNSFHNWVEFGTIFEGLQNFGGGVDSPPLSTPLAVIMTKCAMTI